MSNLSRRQLLKGSLAATAAAGLSRRMWAAEAQSVAPAQAPHSIRSPRVPKVTGAFVNIYKPQADVYTLPSVSSADGHIFTPSRRK